MPTRAFEEPCPALDHHGVQVFARVDQEHHREEVRLDRFALPGDEVFGKLRAEGGGQRGVLLLQIRVELARSSMQFREVLLEGAVLRRGQDQRRNTWLDGTREDAVQTVVVARRDRVELVIMTTRAAHSQAEQPARDHVDAIVDDVVRTVQKPWSQCEEAERGETARIRVVGVGIAILFQEVCRQLFRDEFVERQVRVERGDHVVAVGPRRGESWILIQSHIALGVGVTSHVEPVSPPAFAVA